MLTRYKGAVVVYACLLACLVCVVATVAQPNRPSFVPLPLPPVLTSVPIPQMTLSITGGAYATSEYYAVESSSAPFCIVSFRLEPNASYNAQSPGGAVSVFLEYEDGNGLSYPWFMLSNGQTGGTSPLDVIISQGNQVCASQSIQYEVVLSAPLQTASVSGNMIVLTQPGNAVTVKVQSPT